tara:strand:- start:418 stop:654 length:237 start_codon:yes stop_codon:yes gene_type:complete
MFLTSFGAQKQMGINISVTVLRNKNNVKIGQEKNLKITGKNSIFAGLQDYSNEVKKFRERSERFFYLRFVKKTRRKIN